MIRVGKNLTSYLVQLFRPVQDSSVTPSMDPSSGPGTHSPPWTAQLLDSYFFNPNQPPRDLCPSSALQIILEKKSACFFS